MLNAQGLVTRWKMPYLNDFVHSHPCFIPIICITESWSKSYTSDAMLHIPSYQIFRSDRKKRTRGGALCYVHEDLVAEDVSTFDNKFCEAVIVALPKTKTCVVTLYRPPSCPFDKFLESIKFIEDYVMNKGDSWYTIVSGDFNLPCLDWDTMHISDCLPNDCQSAEKLVEFYEIHGMTQYVTAPTRIDPATGTANTLDLFLTNHPDLICDVTVSSTLLSDHEIIEVNLSSDFKPSIGSARKFSSKSFGLLDFEKADYTRISGYLRNVNWDDMFSLCEGTNSFPDLFYQTLFHICCLCVPLKSQQQSKPKAGKRLKCIRGLKRKLKKFRARFNAIHRYNPDSPVLVKIKKDISATNSQIKKTVNYNKDIQEIHAISKIKENPKYFYSYVKKFSFVKSKVGPLRCPKSNKFISNPKEMANLLQEQFCSVFSDPNSDLKKEPDTSTFQQNIPCLENFNFDENDIKIAIDRIRAYSACGDDEVPAVPLKSCKNEISYPIYLLWKHSLESGFIHEMYRSQTITPVFKKGSKSIPENYRPISLTSHIIKIFERIMHKQISDHLENNSLLSVNQHGFRSKRSCLSELLAHYANTIENVFSGSDSDTLYLDFSKAFDKVDHALLSKKLKLHGIQGKVLKWIMAFLTNRTQRVVINGESSITRVVISGVPQGTVLGPLLFLIYLNDIENAVTHSSIRLFADDARLIHKIDSICDAENLQSDLIAVIDWANANNMVLNDKKFQFLQCRNQGSHNNFSDDLPFVFYENCYKTPSGDLISPVESVSDLGVHMSSTMSFSTYISEITKRGYNRLAWVLSAFKCRDAATLLILFKSVIRSLVEYCSPLWSPTKVSDIQKLEGIQRNLTSKITNCEHLHYWDRLKVLNLMSLQRRRERFIIIYKWKILNNQVPNDIGLSASYRARHGIICEIPQLPLIRRNLNEHERFLKVHGCQLWNMLPKDIKECVSLSKFKYCLDNFLLKFPDTPPITGHFTITSNSILDYRHLYIN